MLQFENKASNSPILVIYSVCTRWTTRNLMYETIFSVKSYAWMEGDGELSGVLILCSFGCFAWCSPNILGGSHRTAWPSRHKAARFKNRDVRQDLQKAFVSLRHTYHKEVVNRVPKDKSCRHEILDKASTKLIYL